jgi:hypothetical protein
MMKLREQLATDWLELRVWFSRVKKWIALTAFVVTGALVFTAALTPSVAYEAMIAILTALIELAGLLIAFTAVAAVQVLAAYRSQLERATDPREVLSRRKFALQNVRGNVLGLTLAVLASVVIMTYQVPGRGSSSGPLFFPVYMILAGMIGLLLIVEEL